MTEKTSATDIRLSARAAWASATVPTRLGAICGACLLTAATLQAWLSGAPAAAALAMSGIMVMFATILGFAGRLARAESARENSEIRLAIAERGRTELLTNMSHELRTPLNAVIGFAQIMHSEMMGPVGTPIYIENARAIEEAGMQLLSTVNDILDIAAVDPSGQDMRECTIDLNELAAGLAMVVKGRAEAARISLSTRSAVNLPLLHADGPYVKQILSNLINNAIKFTRPGGQVIVGTHDHDDGRLAVTVVDTGIGIAAADMDRITQAFAIGENVFSRKFQGQGLGLTIARRLTELHGGTLTLQSQPGEGTAVTVTFPRDRTIARVTAEMTP